MRVVEPRITIAATTGGLRVVHMHVAHGAAAYFGVAVRAGSRDETPEQQGLAHFVEHTIFKGTARRSSWHIINRMESVGGELNAYTTKEETVIYSVFPGANPRRPAELIADLICNSRFPTAELDKEREVVADEIDSYLDSPSEAIYDDYEDIIFAGSPLGHNILGRRTTLATFDSQACRSWLDKYYVAGNMVVFYAGSYGPDRVLALVERYFDTIARGEVARTVATPSVVATFDIVRNLGLHQAHTLAGARTGGINASDRFARALTCNILGGPGMNSLLNVALRERRGLVYNVEASTGLFADCGELVVYYGCDPDDESRCRRLVAETMQALADGIMTPRRLDRAKKQYLGQLAVAADNVDSRILGIARRLLYSDRLMTATETAEAILAVTPGDISAFADSLLPLSTLTFAGPL